MKIKNKNDVLSYLKDNKADFYDQYGICSVGLFGSFARKEQTAESDIDIAIEMITERKNLHNFFAFKRHLEQEFNRKVDVGIESSLKPAVKETIVKDIIYV